MINYSQEALGNPQRLLFISLFRGILVRMQEQIILIDVLSKKGRGVCSSEKFEVPGALEGEEVRVAPGPRQKKHRIGYLREVLTPSPLRVEPRCVHVPQCGGCPLQQLDYGAQLKRKQAQVEGEFERLIQEFSATVRPIVGCDDPWNYRNKMEFSFSENRDGEKFLGLILAGSRGRVFNLKSCSIASSWFDQIVEGVRTWWEESGLSAYHFKTDQGHLRTLTLREAKQGVGKMVMLTVSGNPEFALKQSQIDRFVELIQKISAHETVSIFLQVHQVCKGKPTQFYEMLLAGPDHITERLEIELEKEIYPLEFKISPTSFFQPNTLQAQKLYSLGLAGLSLKGKRVFDLYCGAATLGISAALVAKEVVGIELNPYAVFDARWNVEANKVENVRIEKGDVGELLSKIQEAPDVVIVDPPRIGLDAKALKHLVELSPEEILYISCNPKSQRENAEELIKAGYRLKMIQPVDQFPHTYHIENICVFKRT